MKKVTFGAVVACLGLALTGCNNVKPMTATNTPTHQAKTTAQQHQAYSQRFLCNTGLAPVVTFINDSQIRLQVAGATTTTLGITPSGSGSRYSSDTGLFGNHGGQWHQKGDTAVFEYANIHSGEKIEDICRLQ